MNYMRSLQHKALASLALLTILRASNSPEITDIFVDPFTNGLLFTLYSEEMIDVDNVSSWMSPHGWYYITVNGATFSLDIPGKIPALGQVKDIVIKNNHESGQLAFLVKKPFHSIQILKSEISNAVQVSAVYEVSSSIKQRLGDTLVEKDKDKRLEERTRPLARKKAQDVANRGPRIDYLNTGFNADTLNQAVDEMLDALLVDMADVDDFTNSKKLENETEFIRLNEGKQHRVNDPNIMNDMVKLGDVALKGPASSSVRELFTSKRKWYKDDFFLPKDGPQEKGRLKITSTIDDVTVFIDDEYVGLTPINDNIELTVGPHKVWCIPPVPVNDSRWYEDPISENVIGDAIHNVMVRADTVTMVDFDLYILNTAPNYKEKVFYMDSLGAIVGPEDESRYADLSMERFINKRITSHKISGVKRKVVPPLVKESKSSKQKTVMNGPPPLAVSDLRKSNKKTGEKTQDQTDLTSTTLSRDDIADIVEPDPEEETQDQTDLTSTTPSRDDIADIVEPDPEEKTSNDAGGNMFNRLFSSLKKKGKNGSKREQPDIQDSQLNKPVEEVLEQIETDIEEGDLAAVDVDEKTAKSGRNILKEVFPPKNSIANRQQVPPRNSTIRSADLDVIRIVNAEYVKPNNRRPVNINNEFPSTNHRVYCFTVVQNLGRPVNISHFWYRDGKFMARVPMKVGFSSSWRCWSYITLKDGFEGDWKVVVRGPTNQEIEEINFSIFPDKNLAKKKQ
ncbi:MAG: DUF2914 domain-containing protein [Candidatus Neomarinimicrobiota bacterium]|nr:DUF2914 domain-containing protein [Candidatus Neomarinimicrobiota bacterium]